MKKKDIKKLAQESYQILDESLADTVASLLSRKDLKEYIRQLKFIEKQHEVILALPSIKSYNKNENFFSELFKNKRIIYQEDQSLLLGVKITDNDLVYDMSLKTRLEEEIKQLEQRYE